MKSGARGLTAFAAGLLFGIGLIVSGMTDPARVLAFLDIAGQWNPSLALVMGGAIVAAAPAFACVRRRAAVSAATGAALRLPDRYRIDRPLLVGAAVFGIGWGLSGLCPGSGAGRRLGRQPRRADFRRCNGGRHLGAARAVALASLAAATTKPASCSRRVSARSSPICARCSRAEAAQFSNIQPDRPMNTPDAPVVAALAAVTRQRRLRALRAGGSAARAIPGERAPALQRVL